MTYGPDGRPRRPLRPPVPDRREPAGAGPALLVVADDDRFSSGVVASLVLGPSLVAAFHGGQITGLPRDNVDSEFLLVALLSALASALVLVAVLCSAYLSTGRRRLRRRRGFAARQPETSALPGRGR